MPYVVKRIQLGEVGSAPPCSSSAFTEEDKAKRKRWKRMFWVEFRCSEYHLGHFTLHTLCSCLYFASYFQSWTLGLLISSAAGKQQNTLKTAQEGTEPETSLPVTGQYKQKLKEQLVAQAGKALEEIPVASGVQLLAEEREGWVNKVWGRIPPALPYSNKSLNFSESSKSPYSSGLKADLKERLLTDYPLPGSFLMHASWPHAEN